MTEVDDMLCRVQSDELTALDKLIEELERDDTLVKRIERVRAGDRRIRRLYGLPERDYPPIQSRWTGWGSGSDC